MVKRKKMIGNKEDTTMKKNILSLAALLIASATFVACSNDDNIIDEQHAKAQTYTMTINAAKGGDTTTRALTLGRNDDDTKNVLNASWATSENVYVQTGSDWATGSLQPQTDGATATLKGTLSGNYKISIADGATVTLKDLTINGTNGSDNAYKHAGLSLAGDGTIVLKGTNTVKGFYEDYPGIFVPVDKTVTIKGDGSLNASPFDGGTDNSYGAGIGGGYNIACGNITIEGGNITATGGRFAAGIGGGNGASCGNITITDGVTSVTATKGANTPNSIGAGNQGSCGTVTIGGNVGVISDSPYTYQP